MALFQYICKHAAAAILQGTEITGTTQKIIKCWWCVVQFLETLPLTHWESRPEELCQDKARNLYIIYQIAYVVNIQTSSERYVYLKEKGQRRSVLSIPRT
jgi:hypothetical protein